MLLFEYDGESLLQFLRSGGDVLKVLHRDADLRQIPLGFDLTDLFIASIYMAARNSKFSYSQKQDVLAVKYMADVLGVTDDIFMCPGFDKLARKYGKNVVKSFGRAHSNLGVVRGKLVTSVEIKDGSLDLINTYRKIYSHHKTISRKQTLKKDRTGSVVITNKYGNDFGLHMFDGFRNR